MILVPITSFVACLRFTKKWFDIKINLRLLTYSYINKTFKTSAVPILITFLSVFCWFWYRYAQCWKHDFKSYVRCPATWLIPIYKASCFGSILRHECMNKTIYNSSRTHCSFSVFIVKCKSQSICHCTLFCVFGIMNIILLIQ